MNKASYKISLQPRQVPRVKTKFRVIKTKIPSPSFSKVYRQLNKYDSALADLRLPVLWERAKDFQVFDRDGNCWIDFTSSIFVTNTGHGNPVIIKAVKEQLAKPLLHSYIYPTQFRTDFLQELITVTPSFCEKAYLFSSGSEAIECAIKILKAYGQTFKRPRSAIISFQGAMHGVTMGAEFLRGKPTVLAVLGSTGPAIYRLPFPHIWEVDRNSDYDWEAILYRFS